MKAGEIAHDSVGPVAALVGVVLAAIIGRRRPKPKPVMDAEVARTEAEAARAEAEAELTTAKGYQQLLADVRRQLDDYIEQAAALRKEGHRMRNELQGLHRYHDAQNRYIDALEQALLARGGDLPERPRILTAKRNQPAEVGAEP